LLKGNNNRKNSEYSMREIEPKKHFICNKLLKLNFEQIVNKISMGEVIFKNKFRTSAGTGVSRKKVGRALSVAIFEIFLVAVK
jgi:hypothetical protein